MNSPRTPRNSPRTPVNSPRTPRNSPRTPVNSQRNSPMNLSLEVKNIRHALNPLGKPWAISGSMAMKIHANRRGINVHRNPNDIDIVVRSKDFGLFVSALGNIGYKIRGPPPLRYTDHLKLHKGSKSIDLIRSGSELAPNLSAMNINVFNGTTPVVKVNKLIKQKKITLKHYPIAIAKRNLNFLMSLHKP